MSGGWLACWPKSWHGRNHHNFNEHPGAPKVTRSKQNCDLRTDACRLSRPGRRHSLRVRISRSRTVNAKAELARNLGCHHVINYSTEDFVAVTRKITDGKGVDVVYESIGKDTLQRSLDCLRLVGMCAAYGQASGVPDPIDLIEDLGVRGSLIITRPALSHYMSNRSEIDGGAKSLFDTVAQGVVASNVVKTFPLREAAAAHKFIGGRKTTGSIVMLPFE
jgi:NADPH:quinone reductase-like Zn-dependent oxidoreductase